MRKTLLAAAAVAALIAVPGIASADPDSAGSAAAGAAVGAGVGVAGGGRSEEHTSELQSH